MELHDPGDRLYRRVVKPQQASQLTGTALAGHVALLAVEFRTPRAQGMLTPRIARYVVPWATCPWRKLASAESVGPDDLTGWELPPDSGYLDRFLNGRAPRGPTFGKEP